MNKSLRGCVVFLLASSLVLFGQGTTSRAVGVVTDSSGATIPNATVQLTNEGTGVTFTTTTTSAGTYVLEAVQPGTYTVTVEAPGFKKFTSRGNQVTIGQPMTVNVTMEVGAVTEQVQVSAVAEAVQTDTSGNFGNTLSGQQIRDLPIVGTRGRNPIGLVDLQPGVINTPSITGGAVHVFGARDRAWNYTLDGIDINETSAPGSDFSPLRTNPDSLQEFKVITTNETAEYGRNSGGQVSFITRSGSNEFHGAGFEFYRTPRLNANEWQNNFLNVGKAQFVQHVYGGDLGGPLWKNHTFFFVNVQGLAALNSVAVTRTVYTASARQGLFRFVPGGRNGNAGAQTPSVDFAGNVLPGVTIANYDVVANDPQHLGLDKTLQSILRTTPLPNRFDVGDGLNTAGFSFSGSQHERQHDVVFKIDQIINSKNTVYARVAFGEQDTLCDNANGGIELFPGTGCQVNTNRSPNNMAFNWRWNPTPRVTNELVFGRNRYKFNFVIPTADLNKISFGGDVGTPVDFPFYDFGNLRQITTWQVVDNLSYQVGAHALKFGTNLRFVQHLDQRGSVGSFNATEDVTFNADFDPVAFNIPSTLNRAFDLPLFQSNINFLLGRIGTIERGFPAPNGQNFIAGILPFDARYKELDYYVQDSWKIRKNLTVDLGLRWEMKFAPTSPNPVMRIPNQVLVAGAPLTNTANWVSGSLFHDRLNNLGPSIGLAWDPFGKGRTSIRANYRIAYDPLNTFVLSSAIFNNLPGLTFSYSNTDFGQGGGRLANVPLVGPPSAKPSDFTQPAPYSQAGSITVMDPNFKFPTTHEWAFDFQHEVRNGTVLEASYIGRRAYHLIGAYNANQPNIFGTGFLDAYNIVKAGGQSSLINSLFSADSRINKGETASDMVRRVFSSQLALNSVAAVASSLATRVQGGKSVIALSGGGPTPLVPFPQFGGGVGVLDSNDFSTYHGFILQVQQRLRHGVTGNFSYTFSRALATRSFDPTFTRFGAGAAQSASSTPFDIYNRKLNYAPADYDHTHVWQSNWTAELPFGKGRAFGRNASGFMERVIGGWEVAGTFKYYSGRPFTIYSGANTFNSVVQSLAQCTNCNSSMAHIQDVNGFKFLINPLFKAQFATPDAGQLGNTTRGFFRGPRVFDIDGSFLKRVRITEKTNLELRADAVNLTNTPSFGLPTATITSTSFGRIGSSVESGSRKIQLGAKFNF